MKRPELSIVLLTWNRAPFLSICLENLFKALSYEIPYEIILMDNASTDGTHSVLERYAKEDNVKVVLNSRNLRLNAYKKLFCMARGRIILEVDDDILMFPDDFDKVFVEYLKAYPDYGYLALNVVQNKKTTGAKASPQCYRDDVRGDRVVEEGPTGGWCTAFYRRHYRLFRPFLCLFKFSMARPEDGTLSGFIGKVLRKRMGIIKNAVCLHATGPEYAREFGLMKREYEKYVAGGCSNIAEAFKTEV